MKFTVTETTHKFFTIEANSGADAIMAFKHGQGTVAREAVMGYVAQPEQYEHGAGTELKKLLTKLRLQPAADCECTQHITEMNQRGVSWCEQNINTIIGWLRKEAQRAK